MCKYLRIMVLIPLHILFNLHDSSSVRHFCLHLSVALSKSQMIIQPSPTIALELVDMVVVFFYAVMLCFILVVSFLLAY